MIEKQIDQIRKPDIESLVTARVPERRTLDYKLQLTGNSDADRREFLYDVSSFANASGGDMIFGVEDGKDASGKSTGLPASAEGLTLSNVSDAIARLENLVRDGIEPRIQGIQWRRVDGFLKGPVIVMRIPKSFIGPHMVVFGGMARFYSRNSTGKYPLDVTEIRSAFMESTSIGERLRKVRTQRVEDIFSGLSALGLVATPIIVAHLFPLSTLADFPRDVAKGAGSLQLLLEPIRSGLSWGGRYNFDGYLVTSRQSKSYVQLFRSGAIEAADAALLTGMPEQYPNQLPSIALEQDLLKAIGRYLRVQNQLVTPLPIFIAVTLLRVRGFKMSSNWMSPFPGNEGIDREILELPEVVAEDYSVDLGRLLRPAFDALWQACGIEQSFNYDDEGNWSPHDR